MPSINTKTIAPTFTTSVGVSLSLTSTLYVLMLSFIKKWYASQQQQQYIRSSSSNISTNANQHHTLHPKLNYRRLQSTIWEKKRDHSAACGTSLGIKTQCPQHELHLSVNYNHHLTLLPPRVPLICHTLSPVFHSCHTLRPSPRVQAPIVC